MLFKISKLKILTVKILLICLALGLTRMISHFHLMQQIEQRTIDLRFRFGSPNALDSNIVLILFDDASRSSLGTAPYPRSVFSELIHNLNQFEPKVIALDFLFEGQRNNHSDSLLYLARLQTRRFVDVCCFPEMYQLIGENDAEAGPELLVADEASLPFYIHQLSKPNPAHTNFIIDSLSGVVRQIPLLVKMNQKVIPAFAFKILLEFYDLSLKNITINPEKVTVKSTGSRPFLIPITDQGEFLINYQVSFSKSASLFSVIDFLENERGKPTDKDSTHWHKRLNQKIVLIGSVIDEDLFETPGSVVFPGVFIHATILNNLLKRQFVVYAGKTVHLVIFASLGLCLFLVFWYLPRQFQNGGAAGMLALFTGFNFYLFIQFGLISNLVLPLFFIVSGSLLSTIYENYMAAKQSRILNNLILRQRQQIKTFEATELAFTTQRPFYQLFIPYVELGEKCFLPYWFETKNIHSKEIHAFDTRLHLKNPYLIHLNQVNRIEYEMQQLWQNYMTFMYWGQTKNQSLLQDLQESGQRLVRQFGLRKIFDDLFQSKDSDWPLNLVLNDLRLPWQLCFDTEINQFLCEKYIMSISFTAPNSNQPSRANSKSRQPGHFQSNENPQAVLLYGDWINTPEKQLRLIPDEIERITRLLDQKEVECRAIHSDSTFFVEILQQFTELNRNVRLIHYSGHFHHDYLDIAPDDFLKPGVLSNALQIRFNSNPLVFLNACSSGNVESLANHSEQLATEFLACGAAACIVTTFDIAEKSAIHFTEKFYFHFLKNGRSAGESLRQTICDLNKPEPGYHPENDLTRFAYILYGNPNITI